MSVEGVSQGATQHYNASHHLNDSVDALFCVEPILSIEFFQALKKIKEKMTRVYVCVAFNCCLVAFVLPCEVVLSFGAQQGP